MNGTRMLVRRSPKYLEAKRRAGERRRKRLPTVIVYMMVKPLLDAVGLEAELYLRRAAQL